MLPYDVFESLLREREIHMEKVETGDEVFFRAPQKIKNGPIVTLVVSFLNNSKFVDIEVYDAANLTDPSKKNEFLKVIDELNSTNRFAKFFLSNNDEMVKIFYPMTFSGEFSEQDAGNALQFLITLLETAEEAYPKFMKVLWN